MNRTYLCIDLKTFYASCECVMRGLDPFKTDLVVADPSRGGGAICLAISPHMKERGIKNRCRVYEIPKNVSFITAMPRMKKYIEYSANIYEIYLKYISKDDIHVYSIDEAFLDVTDYLNLYQMDAITLAKTIMKDIYDTTGITATAGIGTNLYLTKIALDITAKHSPEHIGYLNEELYKKELWHHVPLTDFWQIGHGISNRLNKLGLRDMYDVANCNEEVLYKEFGINAKLLIDHSKGIEPCTIKDIKNYKPKVNSISTNQILFEDYNFIDARKVLIEMVNEVCNELVNRNLYASSINIYIGYSKDVIAPLCLSKKLNSPTCSYRVLLEKALEEYDYGINIDYLIRRIGVSLGNVTKHHVTQLDLFSDPLTEENDEVVEDVMNQIKIKYGKDSLLRAISLDPKATQRKRNKLIGGHNA